LVQDDGGLAVAVVDRAGPAEDGDEAELVKTRAAVEAARDLHAGDRLTIAVGGKRAELAGAGVIAVAVDEFLAVDLPLGIGHEEQYTNDWRGLRSSASRGRARGGGRHGSGQCGGQGGEASKGRSGRGGREPCHGR